MRKTFFGRTGLEISELAFGGGVTGGILINPDEATRYSALRRAVAAGINWIDTAPIYGNGASEETIGRHLEALSPRPHVSTKVRLEAERHGRHRRRHRAQPGAEPQAVADPIGSRCSSCTITSAQGVGERLALTPAQVLGRGGVADTFDRLKEQGLIQASGMTAAGDTMACLEVINSGRFDAAQVYYNAINPSAAWRRVPPGWRGGQDFCGILAACFHQNMGVLNIRVWAGGVLASPVRPDGLFVMTTTPISTTRCAARRRCAARSATLTARRRRRRCASCSATGTWRAG